MLGISWAALGLGAKALGLRAAKGAVSGGKSALQWLGSLNIYQFLLLCAVGVIAYQHFFEVIPYKHRAEAAEQAKVIAVRMLTTSLTNERQLRLQIADDNARVDAAAKTTAAERASLAKAQRDGAQARIDAQAVTSQADVQAQQPPAPAQPCVPPPIIDQQWSN